MVRKRPKPEFKKPDDVVCGLSDLVEELFEAGTSLTDDQGVRYFPKPVRSGGSVGAVKDMFNLVLFSHWKNAKPKSKNDSLQEGVTRKLLEIFEGHDTQVDTKDRPKYKRLLEHWKSYNKGEALRTVITGLKKYSDYLSRTIVEVERGQYDKAVSEAANRVKNSVAHPATLDNPARTPDTSSAATATIETYVPITVDSFELGTPEDFESLARGFLRGALPRFSIAKHAAVQRTEDVDRLLAKICEGATMILVSSPVAEGLTTMLMQAAARLLSDQHKPVFWCSNQMLSDTRPEPPAHILIVDDAHLLDSLPDWLVDYAPDRGGNSVVVMGCREYAARRLRKLRSLPWEPMGLSEVSPLGANAYIKLIADYDAADNPVTDPKDEFLSALSAGGGRGGLFPAMFAATRGESLETRFSRLIQDMGQSDPELDALACLAFCNMQHFNSGRHAFGNEKLGGRPFNLPNTRLLESLAEKVSCSTIPPSAEDMRHWIDGLQDRWEGEIRLRPGNRIEFRHDTITHIFFTWIFGGGNTEKGGQRRGEVRRDKWTFYEKLYDVLIETIGGHDHEDARLLVEIAVDILVRDLGHGDVGRSNAAESSRIVVSLIDRAMKDFCWTDSSLGEALVWRARANIALRNVTKGDPKKREELAEAAIADLTRAATGEIIAYQTLLKVARALERLPGGLRICFQSGVEGNWSDVYEMAIDCAEQSGDYRFADMVFVEYLTKLLAVKRTKNRLPWISRYEQIERAARRSDLLANSKFEHTRLKLLLQLANWATFKYRDNQEVPIGSPEDPFPSTKRSVHKALWQEIARLHAVGRLDTIVGNRNHMDALQRARKNWLEFEEADELTRGAWQSTTQRKYNFLVLLREADWHTFADAYEVYFPPMKA